MVYDLGRDSFWDPLVPTELHSAIESGSELLADGHSESVKVVGLNKINGSKLGANIDFLV